MYPLFGSVSPTCFLSKPCTRHQSSHSSIHAVMRTPFLHGINPCLTTYLASLPIFSLRRTQVVNGLGHSCSHARIMAYDLGDDDLDPNIQNHTFPRRSPLRFPVFFFFLRTSNAQSPTSSYHVARLPHNNQTGTPYSYSCVPRKKIASLSGARKDRIYMRIGEETVEHSMLTR